MRSSRGLSSVLLAAALSRGAGFSLSPRGSASPPYWSPTRGRRAHGTSVARASAAAASSPSDGDAPTAARNTTTEGYAVEVNYEGRTTEVVVHRDEPILSALERTGAVRRLAISDPPFECRRGNCLTCAGRHAEGSKASSLRRGGDGLSPQMSKEVRDLGYVLTCSSFVLGDGVKLELGSNSDAWEAVHKTRLESPETERVGMEAKARLMRLAAEQNVPRWAQKTEKALEGPGGGNDAHQ